MKETRTYIRQVLKIIEQLDAQIRIMQPDKQKYDHFNMAPDMLKELREDMEMDEKMESFVEE